MIFYLNPCATKRLISLPGGTWLVTADVIFSFIFIACFKLEFSICSLCSDIIEDIFRTSYIGISNEILLLISCMVLLSILAFSLFINIYFMILQISVLIIVYIIAVTVASVVAPRMEPFLGNLIADDRISLSKKSMYAEVGKLIKFDVSTYKIIMVKTEADGQCSDYLIKGNFPNSTYIEHLYQQDHKIIRSLIKLHNGHIMYGSCGEKEQ